jgi:hypothetical protein
LGNRSVANVCNHLIVQIFLRDLIQMDKLNIDRSQLKASLCREKALMLSIKKLMHVRKQGGVRMPEGA